MASLDINLESGEEFSFGGQITKPATAGAPAPWPNYPSNATGFTLQFTAKRNKSDATPLIQRSNVSDPTNATLGNGGAWTVKILHGDTSAFTKTEELLYDVALIEPDGTRTIVGKGTLKIEKSVGL